MWRRSAPRALGSSLASVEGVGENVLSSKRLLGWIAFVGVAGVLPLAASPAAAQTCASITVNGETFGFDRAYACGQFVTGDWWVVPDSPAGTVTLTSLAPTPYSSGCTASGRNGWQVNPVVDGPQGLDTRIRGTTYQASRVPCLPYAAAPGQSIVKVTSWSPTSAECWWTSNDTTETCLTDAAVLTVLATPPPSGSFRPPYTGTQKPLYSSADLRMGVLPKLPKVAGTPTLDRTRQMFGGPWLDHFSGWPSRDVHASNNARTLEDLSDPADYGAEFARATAEAVLRTLHDETDAQKLPLVIPIVQLGIDLYQQLLQGNRWQAHGGHGNGRKLPILYAGLLLGRSEFLAIGRDYLNSGNCDKVFSEDGQTFIGENGVALFGQSGNICGCSGKYGGDPTYTSYINGGCTAGRDYCRSPDGLRDAGNPAVESNNIDECRPLVPPSVQIAGNYYEAGSYQWCCTSATFIGTATAALILGLKDEWNYDPFFAYVDRWMQPPWNGGGWYGNSYMNEMYKAYRACAPNCGGPPDTTPPSPPVLIQ